MARRLKRAHEFKQKLREGVPLDDLLTNYNAHKDKYKEEHEYRRKGWEKVMYKHEPLYSPHEPFHLNKSYGDKYNMYNETSVSGARYWESKENDEYYSLSRFQRMKMFLKEKLNVSINRDFVLLNLILCIIFIYYARKKSEQIIL
jgi:hypothetical protein